MKIDDINRKQIWEIIRPIQDLNNDTAQLYKSCKENLQSIYNQIIDTSSKIIFDEKQHRYYFNNKECIAVSHVIDFFVQETDFDLVAQNYCRKNNILEPWQRIRQIWNLKATTATTQGTFVHRYAEDLNNICNGINNLGLEKYCLVDEYYYPVNAKQIAVYKYFEYILSNQEIPFLAEVQLILKDHYISGTFDQLVYSIQENGLIMRDYKTNSELCKSFKKPLKSPFSLYNDEPLSHYIIQQNLYSLMLRELGIKVLRKELVWLRDNEQFNLIKLPDLEDEVLKAIEGLY